MKNKLKIIVGIAIILVSAIWFTLLAINPEPHFKITKEGVDVDKIDNNKWQIKKSDLTSEWLEENCELNDSDKYKCGDYLVEVWNQFK